MCFLGGRDLFTPKDPLEEAAATHDRILAVLAKMHAMPVHEAAERAQMYRERFLGSPDWKSLKDAMDLWCACWFWPPDKIEQAPLPMRFARPADETKAVAKRVAAEMRFFHWELEFPDVFREEGSGFDGVLGNPPWEVSKPISMEFFSNFDPLYRSYGKQEARKKQSGYFEDIGMERGWLDYNTKFRAQSNFVKHAASPFGDPRENEGTRRFTIARGRAGSVFHDKWRGARSSRFTGYSDTRHPFRYQGSADLNLYKLFLEVAHGLLKSGGRMGFIVPSGLYSDKGTAALRDLFLNKCRWEWLFGFENRAGTFPIHRSYKFNPVVIEKGGTTRAVRTAFMRHSLDDWESAEGIATPYTLERVVGFSPKTRALLEIQSRRELEILEKMYANGVLLGDDGPDGWGIRYGTEFHMTNDSKLFPPRPQWEAKGYRADEYSRWLLGEWRPIEELWEYLRVDPSRPKPADVELEDWLFDTTARPGRREAEARFVHGHLLKPGDVARTDWRLRCAQPPYDRLPIPRAEIPAGLVLSREADEWIKEDDVEDVALPLYQGLMFYDRLPNVAQHISGSGRYAKWQKDIEPFAPIQPQFLISEDDYQNSNKVSMYGTKIGVRSLSNATNERTVVSGIISDLPTGNSIGLLTPDKSSNSQMCLVIFSSLVFDWAARRRIVGTNMNYHFLAEMAMPVPSKIHQPSAKPMATLGLAIIPQVGTRLELGLDGVRLPLCASERLRGNVIADAVVASAFGLDGLDLKLILADCDVPDPRGQSTGFWRIDKDKPPELRHTVLTLIAFHDLEAKIRDAGGDREIGTATFLMQNQGEGWMLPETLRLADYGLGHDDRAEQPQPVASRLGPRFYDWQLAQYTDETATECHRHARNLQLISDRVIDPSSSEATTLG